MVQCHIVNHTTNQIKHLELDTKKKKTNENTMHFKMDNENETNELLKHCSQLNACLNMTQIQNAYNISVAENIANNCQFKLSNGYYFYVCRC